MILGGNNLKNAMLFIKIKVPAIYELGTCSFAD